MQNHLPPRNPKLRKKKVSTREYEIERSEDGMRNGEQKVTESGYNMM